MRISSQIHREPYDVMSTDDSVVVPGPPSSTITTTTATATLSANTSISTPPTTTMRPQPSITEVSTSTEQKLGSSVDTENVTVASQASLSNASESTEDLKQMRGEVASLDAVSLEGDLGEKKEHAKSAFEIMSVMIDDDLDNSAATYRVPTSADDSLRNSIISKGESGSEEDAISISEDHRVEATVPDTLPEHEQTPGNIITPPISEGSSVQSVPSSTQQVLPVVSDITTYIIPVTTSAPLPAQAVVVNSQGNGAGAQPGSGPSRFKRVNKYDRGRWIVKDMAESQKDPKNPQKVVSERSNSQENSTSSMLSPSISRKTTTSEYSDNELGPLSSASGIGFLSETQIDKDSASSQFDRSSTAAESTLSRNTSLSSILNPDDHYQGVETESVTSASGSVVGRDRDTPEVTLSTQPVSQQPQQVSSSSSSTVNVPVTSSVSREEPHVSGGVTTTGAHGPNCSCEVCTENQSK